MKRLVAYFSASKTTEKVANMIAEEGGYDICEITPKEAYTKADLNWMDKKSRSSVEMKDKKLRIEDALNATKAAVQEGVVAGGGTAPINAIPAVRALCDTLEGDERTGAKIVLKALEAPLRQIAKNAGLEGSVIIDKIISANKPNYGFDAQNEVYVEDMIAAGIVDPTKVTRSALQNAASVAAMVLTTESLVTDKPDPAADAANAAAMAAQAGGGMY